MTLEDQIQAARNNAIWCDTIYRSHGRPGEFRAKLWLNHHPGLPFYPNLVTLTPDGQATQLAGIEELATRVQGDFGIKDSFFKLDLAPLGCWVLFEAEWIYRRAALPKPTNRQSGPRWVKVEDSAALAEWEEAWRGGDAQSDDTQRIFLPPLLADPNVAIFTAIQAERIVAGVIANYTGEVVGLSNLFAPAGEEVGSWAGAVAALIDYFPGLPIVGYESGKILALAQAIGFTSIGPLRIWARSMVR